MKPSVSLYKSPYWESIYKDDENNHTTSHTDNSNTKIKNRKIFKLGKNEFKVVVGCKNSSNPKKYDGNKVLSNTKFHFKKIKNTIYFAVVESYIENDEQEKYLKLIKLQIPVFCNKYKDDEFTPENFCEFATALLAPIPQRRINSIKRRQ